MAAYYRAAEHGRCASLNETRFVLSRLGWRIWALAARSPGRVAIMNKAPHFASACLLGIALFAAPLAARAGCATGAAVGGVAGHVAGHHGLAGAAVGCAIGHHEANKAKKAQAAQANQPARTPSNTQPATPAPH